MVRTLDDEVYKLRSCWMCYDDWRLFLVAIMILSVLDEKQTISSKDQPSVFISSSPNWLNFKYAFEQGM